MHAYMNRLTVLQLFGQQNRQKSKLLFTAASQQKKIVEGVNAFEGIGQTLLSYFTVEF